MTERITVDELLERSRARLDRLPVTRYDDAVADGALVIDTRPLAQRAHDGDLPGAVVLERNVLEWRLDPTSDDAIDGTGYDRHIVIVCHEGYASSVAAATLHDLGLTRATDLIGGFLAWKQFVSESTDARH